MLFGGLYVPLPATRIRETGGPTVLDIAAIAAGQTLTRSGVTVAGVAAAVFGQNYQSAASTAVQNTAAAAFQVSDTTITTPALTGTYRVGWSFVLSVAAGIANAIEGRCFNSTDAVELGGTPVNVVFAALGERYLYSSAAEVVFAGAAKTFRLEWRSTNAVTTAEIRGKRIELWRVA